MFPWLISGLASLRTEDCLVYAFIILGFVMSIIAYDYQVRICVFGNMKNIVNSSV